MFDKKTNRKKIDASYHFFVWVFELYCVILKKITIFYSLPSSNCSNWTTTSNKRRKTQSCELWLIWACYAAGPTMRQATQQRQRICARGELGCYRPQAKNRPSNEMTQPQRSLKAKTAWNFRCTASKNEDDDDDKLNHVICIIQDI